MATHQTITQIAAGAETGMTMTELEAFVDEARRIGIAPDTRIRVTAGFRSQIKAIRTYGPQDAQTDAFIDVFAPKGGDA